jgi:hypothetical protein
MERNKAGAASGDVGAELLSCWSIIDGNKKINDVKGGGARISRE